VPEATRLTGEVVQPTLTPVMQPGRYGEMVTAAKEYIEAGDIFQVVLAQRFTAPFPLPPFALYRSLRRVNPSPSSITSTCLVLPWWGPARKSWSVCVRARSPSAPSRDASARQDARRGQGQ
jgi:anthranilate synthase component 1